LEGFLKKLTIIYTVGHPGLLTACECLPLHPSVSRLSAPLAALQCKIEFSSIRAGGGITPYPKAAGL
jgi:hypothetical protein